jgi:uncharacterized DUF497 family protein
LEIEFDPAKSQRNIEDRGLSFALAAEFDWTSALILQSDRGGEERYIATGFIGERLHVLVFARRGETVRVISLRRANSREVRRYEETRS